MTRTEDDEVLSGGAVTLDAGGLTLAGGAVTLDGGELTLSGGVSTAVDGAARRRASRTQGDFQQ